MLAVIFDVQFGPQYIGDLFLRARRDALVNLKLWQGLLTRAWNVAMRGLLEVERHVEPFGR